MKIYYDLEQRNEEWYELRKGKLTASHAQAIGNNGKGLETYIYEILVEKLSSLEKEVYTNEHIERGIEMEDEAISLYELNTGNKVERVGFVELNEYVGCSPDGLIGDDGGIEIKCLSDRVYLEALLKDKIDEKYIWQIQMNLYITDRKWWDLVLYNPNFEKDFVIKRIKRDKEKIKKIKEGIKKGIEMLKKLEEKYLKIKKN